MSNEPIQANYDVAINVYRSQLGIVAKYVRDGSEDPAFLTPEQAREFAARLNSAADEAEASA